jgi:hypothetical protein
MKYLYIIIFLTGPLFVFSSCIKKETEVTQENNENEIVLDSFASSCPYLTDDGKGNIVISWVREMNDSIRVMCYAVSMDGGNTFGTPVIVAGSEKVNPHGENLPKILFKPDGGIIALWGINKPNVQNEYAGLIYYAQSFDNGKTWSAPQSVSKDTASIDQRYFDIAMISDNSAGVIWLDNSRRIAKEGSTLYYAVTTGAGGFENEKPIAGPCCECCRTNLLIDKKGNINVTYRDLMHDSIRDIVHTISFDGGETFVENKRISDDNWVIRGCPHTGPDVALNSTGLNFVWYTMGNGSGVFFSQSTNNGNTFSPRNNISPAASAKHPQIAARSNNDLLIIWDELNTSNDNNRIGLQYRNANGIPGNIKYITSENTSNSFPVLKTINDKKVLIAYTQNMIHEHGEQESHGSHKNHNGDNKKTHVVYQIYNIK